MIIPIFLFVRYEKKKAVELNSQSLLADAKHWITHIGSMGVVIGGLAGSLIYPHADKIASVIIIAFIIKAGYDVAKDSVKSLLDASVDVRTLDKIKKLLVSLKKLKR